MKYRWTTPIFIWCIFILSMDLLGITNESNLSRKKIRKNLRNYTKNNSFLAKIEESNEGNGNELIESYFNLLIRSKLNSLFRKNTTMLKKKIRLSNVIFDTELKKYGKLINSLMFFLSGSKLKKFKKKEEEKSSEGKEILNRVELVLKILLIFLKISIFLILINVFRWYEKIYSIITEHISHRYSEIEDLYGLTDINVDKLEDKMVYITGKPTIDRNACDTIFHEVFATSYYAKIERVVEFYNYELRLWEPLSRSNLDKIDGMNPCNVELFRKSHLQVSFYDSIFTFPRIFSEVFIGSMSLNGIKLTNGQLKCLTKKEHIGLKDFVLDYEMADPDKFPEDNKEGFNEKIDYYKAGDYIYIYPCRTSEGKGPCRMRVSFFGYRPDFLSILAKVLEGQFRTYRTPFNYEKEIEEDSVISINNSTNMLTNIEINYFANYLCCCFYVDGNPAYIPNDDIIEQNSQEQLYSVNWVSENDYTLEELLYEKHEVSKWKQLGIRVIFCLMLFAYLFVFDDLLFFIMKYIVSKDVLDNYSILVNLAFSVSLVTLIILINKISHKASIFFQLLTCFGLNVFIAIFLIYELFKLIAKLF